MLEMNSVYLGMSFSHFQFVEIALLGIKFLADSPPPPPPF